jgi:ABC-2 type transport system ATP-binding protein
MIILDAVTKIYDSDLFKKKHVALNNIGFQIKENTITGFLGANGAGKTTCIKIILDFIRPTSGVISFSQALGGNLKKALLHIGYLPERPYFYPHLTGREFLEYLGQLSGVSKVDIRKKISEWAPRLKIEAALDRRVHFYSKGMLQRLGFISSIINSPKLLILDEPAAGLDPIGRKEIKDAIVEISKRGTTVFFSSHILSDVEEICSDIVFIKEGELAYSGSLVELLKKKQAKHYTIKYFIGETLHAESVESLHLNERLKLIINQNYPLLSVDPELVSLEEIVYSI